MMIFLESLLLLLLLPTALANGSLTSRQSTPTLTGDRHCGINICISATVNGSTVEYVLESTGKNNLGWMGIGWGHQMTNSPMVILWPNSDGSITLSQRFATAHVEPSVDKNPPRAASLSSSASSVSGSTSKLAFTIPANDDSKPSIIYAFSTTNPNSSAVDAHLVEHIENTVSQLDLTKPLPSSSTSASGSSAATKTGSGTASSPTSGKNGAKAREIGGRAEVGYLLGSWLLWMLF